MDLFAPDEDIKFLKNIAGHKWLVPLGVTRQNMLSSTVSDSEIESKMVNEHEILPTLLAFLQKFDPRLAKTLRESLKIEWKANISIEQPANTTEDMSDIENDIFDDHDESDTEQDTTIPDSTAVNISEDKQQVND